MVSDFVAIIVIFISRLVTYEYILSRNEIIKKLNAIVSVFLCVKINCYYKIFNYFKSLKIDLIELSLAALVYFVEYRDGIEINLSSNFKIRKCKGQFNSVFN